MTTCDFAVAAWVVEPDGVTEVLDFNDDALGLSVETIVEPEENWRTVRVVAPRVDGSFPVASAAEDGVLLLSVHVTGSTWAEVASRWEVARAAYNAEAEFYLKTEIEGVTKLWAVERPNVTPQTLTAEQLNAKWLTYVLRFRAQPNPTVEVAP